MNSAGAGVDSLAVVFISCFSSAKFYSGFFYKKLKKEIIFKSNSISNLDFRAHHQPLWTVYNTCFPSFFFRKKSRMNSRKEFLAPRILLTFFIFSIRKSLRPAPVLSAICQLRFKRLPFLFFAEKVHLQYFFLKDLLSKKGGFSIHENSL